MSRRDTTIWSRAVQIGLLALLVLAAALAPQRALALEPADVAFSAQSIDLLPYFAGLETQLRDVPIERPDLVTGTKDFMTLHGKGPGPNFHWIAAAFRNTSGRDRDVVIVIPDQGFVGSGLPWPMPPGGRVVSITTAGDITLDRLPSVGKGAYGFTLRAGKTGAIAFETSAAAFAAAKLWQRDTFDAQKDYLAFFRGALLGIAMLLTVAMFALYGFRARAVFLAAGGFALSSVGFMMIEAGHLPLVLDVLRIAALNLPTARAIVEGSMAAFLILLLVTIAELRRIVPVAGNILAVAGGLALAVPIYGFAEPLQAAGIARAIFALTAIGGFALIFWLWRGGEAKVETSLVSWSAILLWTFIAAVAIISDAGNAVLSPVLLAGLCAVLVILGFTLAHYAFSQGYLSRHFFREAGRRALALAGARAYVWDWQPEEGDLHVGEEIERALGQPEGVIADAGAEAFVELIHPADRSAYLAAVEEAESDGRGAIEKEFRLRHGDGTYRWFQLRAKAMPGFGQRAARCIGTLTDVTAAKRAEERLLSDAVYDRVTGLPNRALFTDRLSRALSGAEGHGVSETYVLLIDIDRFKLVNDALGHEVGDSLLNVVGRRLLTEADVGDSVARMPGDQFAILFANASGERDTAEFTESIRKAVARPIMIDQQEIFLTASIGVAHFREAGLTADQLLKDAAIALYEAKRRGSDTIEVFDTSMRDDRAELVVLEQELRRAIERDEIEVHYQPIARLADMNLAGFEALVRWRHPSLGLLAPESFIGLAEQTGMIKDIGRTVLNEAGRQLGIWQRAFRPAEPVFAAVNISSAQLIEPDLIDEIKQVLHREGLRRGSLKIEVTESLVMQYPERAGQILERFAELGVGISCDDFGTGYSSLSSLRKLPFDTLKVDQSFIAADAADPRASIILESIITLGHALGLNIVAEGIENQEQVDRLGQLNCDLGQGYFIGKPMTAKQVNDALTGLPYASSTGRTAITWLWERAAREPHPEPRLRDVTAAGIAEANAALEAETAAAAAVAKREARPPPPRPVLTLPSTHDSAMQAAADESAEMSGSPKPRRKKRKKKARPPSGVSGVA